MGFNDHEEKKPKVLDSGPGKLIKNQECVSCKKMFECKGKPRSVERCINYEERKNNGER